MTGGSSDYVHISVFISRFSDGPSFYEPKLNGKAPAAIVLRKRQGVSLPSRQPTSRNCRRSPAVRRTPFEKRNLLNCTYRRVSGYFRGRGSPPNIQKACP